MEEIILNKIEWQAPEYKHKEKSMDFLWTIGIVAIIMFVAAVWQQNYVFSIFILIAAASLILFSVRPPQMINFSIETSGLTLGKDKYVWKKVKGFHIKKEDGEAILLVEVDKYLLPVYTIPLTTEIVDQVRESMLKVSIDKELEESKSMKFMEKLGF